MPGSKAGGKKASVTNRTKHGADFYSRIGAMGGKRTHELGKLAPHNFANNPERARQASLKGVKARREKER